MIQSIIKRYPDDYDLEREIIHDSMHIENVLDIISKNINPYIEKYLMKLKKESVEQYFNSKISLQKNETEKYKRFFEKYVVNEGVLDPKEFRRSLGKYCPIFHGAINSTTEVLNAWKDEFFHCDCDLLYKTLYNIKRYTKDYNLNFDEDKIKAIKSWKENKLVEMEEEDQYCYLTGVIGYGVASTVVYNLYPRLFPGNFKQGVFALYFLSGRGSIDMQSNTSEFIMVKDLERSKTGIIESDHNYFFPYEVYAYYSLKLYKRLRKYIFKYLNYKFDNLYRYTLTNDFYSFVIQCNNSKMQTLLGNDDYLKFETWSLF